MVDTIKEIILILYYGPSILSRMWAEHLGREFIFRDSSQELLKVLWHLTSIDSDMDNTPEGKDFNNFLRMAVNEINLRKTNGRWIYD